jgi:hypothetical protein
MIIYFDKFQIENLLDVISYLRKNLNHLRNVIEDFGEIKFENGIDTIFLNPKNKLFTLISISYDKYKQINTVSFTGDFNIKFIDLEKNFSIKDSNYSISIDGTLTNLLNGKIKKWTKDTNGYMKTQIWTNGKCLNITQHRILAQYFIDNLESKTQVNHINGIKHDNHIENLEGVTQSENSLHSFANGLQKVTRPCK